MFSTDHALGLLTMQIWFGAEPWVIVVDAEMGRKVNYKFLNRPKSIQNPLARGELIKEENRGLFFARCDGGRTLETKLIFQH